MLKIELQPLSWPLRQPFRISRGIETSAETMMVTITDPSGARGRGESCGVDYAGESVESMIRQVEAVRDAIEQGVDRAALAQLLPAGGARAGVDAALWDLEAKRSGTPAWRTAGLVGLAPVETVFTIGIRDLPGYEAAAREHADFRMLKVKVADQDPIAAIEAVRRGAPAAQLIVDPNQAWTVADIARYAPRLAELGVVLLEQPVAAGAEDGLESLRRPVPIAADEAVQGRADLARVARFYDVVNIKLDKTGGLTEALHLADEAEALGLELMVGCMLGSSISIAPAHLLAQRCRYVDLDSPLLQREDWPDGLRYRGGIVDPPTPDFWG